MKLKEIYSNCCMSKRINGKMITFDVKNTSENDYEFFYNNGFSECFEPIIKTTKRIKYKNDSETPIINLGSTGEFPSAPSDK